VTTVYEPEHRWRLLTWDPANKATGQKKMILAVVMVQKQYEQKFVPGTKNWYDVSVVHFGNGV